MYPAVTFWWLKACCDSGHLFHPCEAALFKPRPNPGGCPDFKGKVVAFAGLSKAPAAFEQYMKETILVLGCSWSGEMHKGVHALINCCPPLQDNDKITWTCVDTPHSAMLSLFNGVCSYHHALHIPVVTAKWLDAVSSVVSLEHTPVVALLAANDLLPQCASRWCWLPTEPFKVTWEKNVSCSLPLSSSPIIVRACGRRPNSRTFSACFCRSGC